MGSQSRDLERATHVVAGRGEQEADAVREPALRLEQRPERGRVDEADLAEVDDQPLGRVLGRPLECRADVGRVVEVELAGEPDDHVPVAPHDCLHRRPAQSVRFPRPHLADKRIRVAGRLTPARGLRTIVGTVERGTARPVGFWLSYNESRI